ncbi:MAG: recombination mediator RecR [Alphaproteobacteria bacterium]|nr:recombination mediator RecR [Alphaproteobacteria bacterium]
MGGSDINHLVSLLSRLPGLGPRSARRVTLHLLKKRDEAIIPLIEAFHAILNNVKSCVECGNLDNSDICTLCMDRKRDITTLCVVEDVVDLWALERAHIFQGHYHVLGGVLSALDGIGPDQLNIEKLKTRVQKNSDIKEIILALPTTMDGQATTYYLQEFLSPFPLVISHLAHGVPVGGELDYMDDNTLAAALKARRPII